MNDSMDYIKCKDINDFFDILAGYRGTYQGKLKVQEWYVPSSFGFYLKGTNKVLVLPKYEAYSFINNMDNSNTMRFIIEDMFFTQNGRVKLVELLNDEEFEI